MEDRIRLCVIGYGNIGTSHCGKIMNGEAENTELAAVCDINPKRLEAARQKFGDRIKYYESAPQALAAGGFDSAAVCVPHYSHPPVAIACFEAGKNVLCEKPICVSTSQARKITEAARRSGKVFGIMYNQRTNPLYQKLRSMVKSGELGAMKRVVWIITNWYRSQSYYDSGGWRATWGGEGGGVLLNQDPHQLDLWQWICGMPRRIRAFAYEGVCRNIEVENDVTAFAEYDNGATGLFVTSTHETPGTNRLEISADMGRVVIENNVLTFNKNRVSEPAFNAVTKTGFGEPGYDTEVIKGEDRENGHMRIFSDFASAVLRGTPLLAPGEEGVLGLSISNSIHLSAWTGKWAYPQDPDEAGFDALLAEKIAGSTFKKTVVEKFFDTEGTY